jgi:hypothetical protein
MLGVVAGLLGAPPAGAQDYFPLQEGYLWRYEGIAGAGETNVVQGTVTLFGEEASVIDYQESTVNTGLENYWTTEADGDVKLWGFFREVENIGRAYDPPILVLDAPLSVGASWSTEVDIYSYPDLVYLATGVVSFEVLEEGVVVVPAGAFFAYGIVNTFAASAHGGFSLSGEKAPGTRGSAPRWYSASVGLVQYDSDQLYQLEYSNLPVSIEATTWSRVKTPYRE